MRCVTRSLVFLAATTGCVGCGPASNRRALEGDVSFRGAPVREGAIQFFPDGVANGDSTGAMIVDGKYKIPAENGLPPGVYAVSISAPNHKGKRPSLDEAPGAPFVAAELLPDKYNRKSILKVEVSSDPSKTRHDFPLD